MTANNAEGLWALIMARYAGNLHIIANADGVAARSLIHHAEQENAIYRSLSLEHFGLAEALEQIRELVAAASDFPP